MQIEPIAFFESALGSKFGVPRQSGLAKSLRGRITLQPAYARSEALEGIGGFSHLWLIWGFHLNSESGASLTVRPPRLGGNKSVGVFASRSPFRPNGMGLSAVKIEAVNVSEGIIEISGADLANGTPIFDIKPYVPYADSIPEAKGGFTDTTEWEPLNVVFELGVAETAVRDGLLDAKDIEAVAQILALDPRPRYHDNPERTYGMEYKRCDIRFCVSQKELTVKEIIER